jgi:hypothetical protein
VAVASHGNGFSELRSQLGAQPLAEARLASEDLFNLFFDMVASLIGEDLTNHILRSAWSRKAPDLPEKELPQ